MTRGRIARFWKRRKWELVERSVGHVRSSPASRPGKVPSRKGTRGGVRPRLREVARTGASEKTGRGGVAAPGEGDGVGGTRRGKGTGR